MYYHTRVHYRSGSLGLAKHRTGAPSAAYVFPDLKATQEVSWLCVLDLGEWEMQPIVWHSPAHLKRAARWNEVEPCPCAAAKLGPPVHVLEGAAREVLFKLPLAPLLQLGDIIGVSILQGNNLLDAERLLRKHILKPDDRDLLPILAMRMLTPLQDTVQVLEAEEFRANLDASDLKELDKFKEDLAVEKKRRKSFEESFAGLGRQHRAEAQTSTSSSNSLPAASGRGSGRGSGSGSGSGRGRGRGRPKAVCQGASKVIACP